jgi:hypothetical protein
MKRIKVKAKMEEAAVNKGYREKTPVLTLLEIKPGDPKRFFIIRKY